MSWMVESGGRAWTRSCPNILDLGCGIRSIRFLLGVVSGNQCGHVSSIGSAIVRQCPIHGLMEVPRVLRRETIVGITA